MRIPAMDHAMTRSPMTSPSDERCRIRDAIERLCAGFGDAYWLERDRLGGFPEEFYSAVARDGWLGIAMPEGYGGSGLGISDAATIIQAVAEAGARAFVAAAGYIDCMVRLPRW